MSLTISATRLGELAQPNFCDRCFWIQRRMKETPFHIPLPGVFSSIDTYIKNVLRRYFDTHKQLPRWFPDIGEVTAYELNLHYSKFRVQVSQTGVTLQGSPDEIFHLRDSKYYIVDYKTARLSNAQDILFPRYEVQLNAYTYISARIGLSPIKALSLVYLDPDTNLKASPGWLERSVDTLMMGFTAIAKPVDIKPDTFIESLVQKAKEIYELPAPPHPNNSCNNCSLIDDLLDLVSEADPR